MMSSSSVPIIFCGRSIRQKKRKSLKYTHVQDPLKKHIETILLEKWQDFSFQSSPECLFHGFTSFSEKTDISFLWGSIFSDTVEQEQKNIPLFSKEKYIVFEEEALPFKTSVFDSIWSAQTLHFVNDVPGALVQARYSLKEKGIYGASFFGTQTAQEIKSFLYEVEEYLTGKVQARFHPLIDAKEVPALLQRVGFSDHLVETEIVDMTYSSLESLLFHLRQSGITNSLTMRHKGLTSPRLMQKIVQKLLKRLSFPLSVPYEVIYVTAGAGKGL